MNQATSINNLQNDAQSQGDELIDNVLKSLEHQEEAPVQQRPSANVMEDVSVASSNTESSNNLINNAIKKSSNDMVSSVEASEQAERMIDGLIGKQGSNKGWFERLLDEMKDPFLAMVLFALFQSGVFNTLFTNIVGKYLGTEPTFLSMGVKSFIFALLFFVLKKLLL